MSETLIRLSPLRPTWALLMKDLRLFRPLLIALATVVAACFVTAFLSGGDRYDFAFPDRIALAAEWVCGVAPLFAVALAASALAGERASHGAEFLALMPVTRLQIVLSKWIAGGSAISVTVGINLCLQILMPHVRWGQLPHESHVFDHVSDMSRFVLSGAACMAGFAWFFSAVTSSYFVSAGCAWFVTSGVSLAFSLMSAKWTGKPIGVADLAPWLGGAGLCGLAAGTVCYLRRVSP